MGLTKRTNELRYVYLNYDWAADFNTDFEMNKWRNKRMFECVWVF